MQRTRPWLRYRRFQRSAYPNWLCHSFPRPVDPWLSPKCIPWRCMTVSIIRTKCQLLTCCCRSAQRLSQSARRTECRWGRRIQGRCLGMLRVRHRRKCVWCRLDAGRRRRGSKQCSPACDEADHLGLREALAGKGADMRLQVLLRLRDARRIGFTGVHASSAERDFRASALISFSQLL